MLKKEHKIYVAGHAGLVGSALLRCLKYHGYRNIVTRSPRDVDLRNQEQVNRLFADETPDYVFIAAAKVGGILANNTYRAEFLYDNLMIAANLIHASYTYHVEKLLCMGSSCIYPRECAQPIREECLLTGPLEATNEPYAIAKIAGLKLVESYNNQYHTNYISVMPTNLYGPHDNYHLENSHVIPAMMLKFHSAKKQKKKSVKLWGSGTPRREFLFVDDLAEACLFVMKNVNAGEYPNDVINLGSGKDHSIKETAEIMKSIVGFNGDIEWDDSKPDGAPRKLLDVSRATAKGWSAATTLEDGLQKTYRWFIKNTPPSLK